MVMAKHCGVVILPVLLASPLALARNKDKHDVLSHYDRFEDVTTVETKELYLRTILGLSARYSCKGQESHCQPDFVSFVFEDYCTQAQDGDDCRRFFERHDLILLADGQRYRADGSWDDHGRIRAPWLGAVGMAVLATEQNTETKLEFVTVNFDISDFLAFTKAKKIEGRPGGVDWALSPKELKVLEALASELRSR